MNAKHIVISNFFQKEANRSLRQIEEKQPTNKNKNWKVISNFFATNDFFPKGRCAIKRIPLGPWSFDYNFFLPIQFVESIWLNRLPLYLSAKINFPLENNLHKKYYQG